MHKPISIRGCVCIKIKVQSQHGLATLSIVSLKLQHIVSLSCPRLPPRIVVYLSCVCTHACVSLIAYTCVCDCVYVCVCVCVCMCVCVFPAQLLSVVSVKASPLSLSVHRWR